MFKRNLGFLQVTFLLFVHEVVVCVLVTQSCLTICDPMDCSPSGYSDHGILQTRILEWIAISFSRGSSQCFFFFFFFSLDFFFFFFFLLPNPNILCSIIGTEMILRAEHCMRSFSCVTFHIFGEVLILVPGRSSQRCQGLDWEEMSS